MSCESCSDNDYTVDNSNTDCSNNSASCGAANCRCRLSVTVDTHFIPCTFQQDIFDVTVTNRDGELVASGKVAGGNSAVFTLPAEGEYAVTVTGDACASPRAQTRRVRCCCGQANGVSFIFMKREQGCGHKPPHNHCGCPPVPRPPMPPCPPKPPCPCEPPKPPCPCEPPKPLCPPEPPCPPHHPGGIDPHDVILISEGSLQDFQ